MRFELINKDKKSSARYGKIITDHGAVETPFFMPVGTIGSVKSIHVDDLLNDCKADIMLSNTYHLYLRPGCDVLKNAGGIHKFNGWQLPVLTDSGGYQVYSLAANRKIKDEGVVFRSHIDGSKHLFTPENVMDIQRIIGADIIMAFDECTPYPCEYNYASKSLDITHNWLIRCIKHFDNTEPIYDYSQALFPIVQGSTFRDLRVKSAEYVASLNRDGNAIGGLSVGEPHEEMYEMTDLVCNILPDDKPRYLMGVGTPANILECISLGVDMFDCVMPTRNGRNGMLFTSEGILNIKNEKWKNDFSALDKNGTSKVDINYSKAFVRHLFVAGEMLGPIIATAHNLAFYLWLMKEARNNIKQGTFAEWKNTMLSKVSLRL